MRIIAGFVLFNPNKDRFEQSLRKALLLFDEIILFDNVGNQQRYEDIDDRVCYMTEGENKGLAHALISIMKMAKNRGADWVVTLDQDTILPDNLVSEFKKYSKLPKAAIIAPQVVDKRRPYQRVENCIQPFQEIEFAITSASFTNVEIYDRIGGFDEWLFIDFIDNDYCKRVKIEGFKIYRLNNVVIDQEFGKIELKSPSKVKFFLWLSKVTKNKNIAKLTYNKSVSPTRVYFVHRNLLYLNKKFRNYGGIGYENFFCHSFLGFLFYFSLPSLVRGKQKCKIFKAIFKGLYDGLNSKPYILI